MILKTQSNISEALYNENEWDQFLFGKWESCNFIKQYTLLILLKLVILIYYVSFKVFLISFLQTF